MQQRAQCVGDASAVGELPRTVELWSGASLWLGDMVCGRGWSRNSLGPLGEPNVAGEFQMAKAELFTLLGLDFALIGCDCALVLSW